MVSGSLCMGRTSVDFFQNDKSGPMPSLLLCYCLQLPLSSGGNLLVLAVKVVRNKLCSQTLDSARRSVNPREDQAWWNNVTYHGKWYLLYHIPIYRTALKEDGTYDFHENFEYVKPWLKQADFSNWWLWRDGEQGPLLAGYPLFNAPGEVMDAIKDAGYQVLDLAHNHIFDSQNWGSGFNGRYWKGWMTPIGVYAWIRDQAP